MKKQMSDIQSNFDKLLSQSKTAGKKVSAELESSLLASQTENESMKKMNESLKKKMSDIQSKYDELTSEFDQSKTAGKKVSAELESSLLTSQTENESMKKMNESMKKKMS